MGFTPDTTAAPSDSDSLSTIETLPRIIFFFEPVCLRRQKKNSASKPHKRTITPTTTPANVGTAIAGGAFAELEVALSTKPALDPTLEAALVRVPDVWPSAAAAAAAATGSMELEAVAESDAEGVADATTIRDVV